MYNNSKNAAENSKFLYCWVIKANKFYSVLYLCGRQTHDKNPHIDEVLLR